MEVNDVEVNRLTRIPRPQKVGMDAVRFAARRGATCRQQSLRRDVPAENMIGGRRKLLPDEAPLADPLDSKVASTSPSEDDITTYLAGSPLRR